MAGVSSCSKGNLVKDPAFGSFSISDFTAQKVAVVEGVNNKLTVPIANVSVVSGDNRFRFYDNNILLLDTLLKIEAFKNHKYFMLRPNDKTRLRVFDDALNGFNQEALPAAGSVKISLANLSKALPDKVNVYVTTTTYKVPGSEEIGVGDFLKISASFSGFETLLVGKDQFLKPIKEFTLLIKDPNNQAVLFSTPLVLPVETATVYLIYLDDKGTDQTNIRATLLMSK